MPRGSLFWLYTFAAQIVLVNLLIAMMTEVRPQDQRISSSLTTTPYSHPLHKRHSHHSHTTTSIAITMT